MSSRAERLERLDERSQLVQAESSARHWDQPLEAADYFVIDLETSGFDPASDLVLSLAAMVLSPNDVDRNRDVGEVLEKPVDLYEMVRQDQVDRVPQHIWKLTGLSPDDIAHGRDWKDVLLEALSLSANRVWIAHHARHEMSFVQRYARVFWKIKVHPLIIDTAVVAQTVFQWPQVPTLDQVCERLGVPVRDRHRADADVQMTALAWKQLMVHCHELGLNTIGDVIHWCQTAAR